MRHDLQRGTEKGKKGTQYYITRARKGGRKTGNVCRNHESIPSLWRSRYKRLKQSVQVQETECYKRLKQSVQVQETECYRRLKQSVQI